MQKLKILWVSDSAPMKSVQLGWGFQLIPYGLKPLPRASASVVDPARVRSSLRGCAGNESVAFAYTGVGYPDRRAFHVRNGGVTADARIDGVKANGVSRRPVPIWNVGSVAGNNRHAMSLPTKRSASPAWATVPRTLTSLMSYSRPWHQEDFADNVHRCFDADADADVLFTAGHNEQVGNGGVYPDGRLDVSISTLITKRVAQPGHRRPGLQVRAAIGRTALSPAPFICDFVPLMEERRMVRKRAVRNTPARFQVEIMREELDEMERLCELGGLSSKKELLNNALTLLKWAVRQKQQGYSIASVDENGDIRRELEMPYLESVGLKSRNTLKVVHSGASEADEDRFSEESGTDELGARQRAAVG